MYSAISDYRSMARGYRRAFIASVCAAIRGRLARRDIVDLAPENDADLMNDLALLMAARIELGHGVISNSGLSGLWIEVDGEYAETWHEGDNWRDAGMLDPSLLPSSFASPRAVGDAVRAAASGPLAAAGVREAAA
jgi:hypothetical protein